MPKIWIECQKCKGKIEYELDDIEPDVQYVDCNECGYTNLIYDYLVIEEATKQGLVVHDRNLDRWEWISNKKINEVFERK